VRDEVGNEKQEKSKCAAGSSKIKVGQKHGRGGVKISQSQNLCAEVSCIIRRDTSSFSSVPTRINPLGRNHPPERDPIVTATLVPKKHYIDK